LAESKLTKDAIAQQGVLDFWMEQCFRSQNFENVGQLDHRLEAVLLLGQIWMNWPLLFEEDEDLGSRSLALIKRATRERSHTLRFPAFVLLFDLLDCFAADKNPYAPVVYKLLVFSSVEVQEDPNYREFLAHNFVEIFKRYSAIPVSVFLDAYVKAFQLRKPGSFDSVDVNLCRAMVSHKKLSLRHAILLFDTLGRAFVENIPHGPLISKLLVTLVLRNVEEEEFRAITMQLIKVLTGRFVKKMEDLPMSEVAASAISDKTLLAKHERAMTVQLLKDLALLSSASLNSEMLSVVLFTNYKVKRLTGEDAPGLVYLLNFLVDPESDGSNAIRERIEAYEAELEARERLRNGTSEALSALNERGSQNGFVSENHLQYDYRDLRQRQKKKTQPDSLEEMEEEEGARSSEILADQRMPREEDIEEEETPRSPHAMEEDILQSKLFDSQHPVAEVHRSALLEKAAKKKKPKLKPIKEKDEISIASESKKSVSNPDADFDDEDAMVTSHFFLNCLFLWTSDHRKNEGEIW
jgi:hypothetical protein